MDQDMEPEMDLSLIDKDSETIQINIDGEFSFSHNSKFHEMLKRVKMKSFSRIIIDMSNTSYIDSAALGMLLLLKEAVDDMQGEVEITGVSGQVLQVLELSRFQDLFSISQRDKPAA